MLVCVGIYGLLLFGMWRKRRGKLPDWIPREEAKKLFLVLLASNTIALALMAFDFLEAGSELLLERNSYGGGEKTESFEVTVEGELEGEPLDIEVGEREYTASEIQDIFVQMMKKLDEVILGDNESRDHVETDLNLVERLGEYPVDIRWELSNYEVLSPEGHVILERTTEDGTMVEVRGILSYRSEEAVYVTHVMVYPETKTGKEKWLSEIAKLVKEKEEATRQETSFTLPESVDGKEIQWEKKKSTRGYEILFLGIVGCALLLFRSRQEKKEETRKRQEQMIRDYPDIISKLTLLLGTGMTVKQVWTKMVQNYEGQKERTGERAAYEEMCVTYHEMQSGVSEAEAYARFGKRCGIGLYMKFGALLSQNLRKGSKGLCELLGMESIQAWENRKSTAKRQGEEASTKLLLPMFGMLTVVMIMVIVPAFLSIQL